jgi:hypothetical protein
MNIGWLWLVIAANGVRIAGRSQWIRRTVLFSWLPALSMGVFFFLYEYSVENHLFDRIPAQADVLRELKQSPLGIDPDLETLVAGIKHPDEGIGRRQVWSWMFTAFFKYSQGAMLLLLIGLIAPPLISKDVRTRAFLLYFSRPIGRTEYILGKLFVPAFFVAAVTLVPALLLYLFGILLAPSFSVVLDTWDLPFRIVAASLVAIVPASALSLMFSSLTSESRFAAFAWFSVWTLGAVAWLILYYTLVENIRREGGDVIGYDSHFSMLSIYHTIGKVQRWIFGLEPDVSNVLPSIMLLGLLTLFALYTLWRRVSAPIRV